MILNGEYGFRSRLLILLLMEEGSLDLIKDTIPAQVDKQVGAGEETSNFTNNKISKSSQLFKNTHLYYEHIPMPKPVPQWNKSAATLRHSSSFHRFSHSERFPPPKSNYRDSQKLNLPSTLTRRASSMGFGEKTKIPDTFSNGIGTATKLCPFYNISDDIKRSSSAVSLGKGKTFGLGWKYYEPAGTFYRDTVHCSYQVKSNPGPNYYMINPEKKEKIKMHERLPMFTTLNGKSRMNEPCPQTYFAKEQVTSVNKRATSLGLSNKVDFTKLREKSPGPIYSLNGFCDKFVHLKMKLGQK